jgi:dihydroneopterin aldolase/2-amino-4-hydroxy-6-hydroxymethyldihydropteridine diphosphokinase
VEAVPDRGVTLVLVSIGSNIDPERNIERAVQLLRKRVAVIAMSDFYWTKAFGPVGQPDFLNGACQVETNLSARALKFDVLRAIERELGRVRGADKYAPRTIDLDLVLYGDEVLCENGLNVPDPDIRSRPFLAVPLSELAFDYVLPGEHVTLGRIAERLGRGGLAPAHEFSARLKARLSP